MKLKTNSLWSQAQSLCWVEITPTGEDGCAQRPSKWLEMKWYWQDSNWNYYKTWMPHVQLLPGCFCASILLLKNVILKKYCWPWSCAIAVWKLQSYRSQDQRGVWLFCQIWSFCNDSVVYCFYRTSLLFSLSCKLALPRSLVTCCLLPKTNWETINSSYYPSLSVINSKLAYFQFYSFGLCYYKVVWDFL